MNTQHDYGKLLHNTVGSLHRVMGLFKYQAQKAHAPFDTYQVTIPSDELRKEYNELQSAWGSPKPMSHLPNDDDEFIPGGTTEDFHRSLSQLLVDEQIADNNWLAELEIWWSESNMGLLNQYEPYQNFKYLQYLMIHGELLWNNPVIPLTLGTKFSTSSIGEEESCIEQYAAAYVFAEYYRITNEHLPSFFLVPPSSVENVRMILCPTHNIIIWIGFNKKGGYRPCIWVLKEPKYYEAFHQSMTQRTAQAIEVIVYHRRDHPAPDVSNTAGEEDCTTADGNAADDTKGSSTNGHAA